MKSLPTSALLNILKYNHNALYFGKTYFKELLELKNTFKQYPVIFSYKKSIQYLYLSGKKEYFKRNTSLRYTGSFIGNSLLEAENIMKRRINREIYKHYTLIEICGSNFKLQTYPDRFELYQTLFQKPPQP